MAHGKVLIVLQSLKVIRNRHVAWAHGSALNRIAQHTKKATQNIQPKFLQARNRLVNFPKVRTFAKYDFLLRIQKSLKITMIFERRWLVRPRNIIVLNCKQRGMMELLFVSAPPMEVNIATFGSLSIIIRPNHSLQLNSPESIKDGVTLGKQLVADKGVDGAIEFVKTGDEIEWASTGYEVLSKLRDEEASLRADNSEAADLVAQKRLEFLNDFTEGATKRGQSRAGIRAIEEFAPDRAVYVFNRTAMKRRGRGLSQDEEARVAARGQETVDRLDRDKALSDALAEIARLKARKAKSSSGIAKPRAPK